jgi:hypothetical protein
MNDVLGAAQRLHQLIYERFWRGESLIGPDNAVRFNRRVGRFVKSYLAFLPWHDDYYYVQGQGYWVLSNWLLYDLLGEQRMADLAQQCAQGILRQQRPEGCWAYPHPGWAGRVATVECVFGGIGLLATYERTHQPHLMQAISAGYDFLVNRIGFQETGGGGRAVNYFANIPTSLVPNNSTLVLMFLGRLAQVTGDERYLEYGPGLIKFLYAAQLESGELPYSLKNQRGEGRERTHFQCYQYHAFELQDLVMYYEATGDASVLPLAEGIARFIAPSIQPDGSTRFDCLDSGVQIPYNTLAIAAALGMARHAGLCDAADAENRAYAYVLSRQHADGGFGFSSRDYGFLEDRRYYPRPLAMMLYHLLCKVREELKQSVFAGDHS